MQIRRHDGIHVFAKPLRLRRAQACVLCQKEILAGEEAIVVQWQERGRYIREYYCFNCAELVG